MTALLAEVTDVTEITRIGATQLPHKVFKVTFQSDDTESPEMDFRGFRKCTVHAPTPATTSSATKMTMSAAPESGGTFGTVNDNDAGADVEFNLDGKANTSLRLAGQGFLKATLDAAYTTGTTGADTDVYFVFS